MMLFDAEQHAAVELIAGMVPICVVTGAPGTGKTTCTVAALEKLQQDGKTFALAAPTGKAAQRFAQVTGYEAQTIHRLLKWLPGGFQHNQINPLPFDVVLIDEASMIDVFLFADLAAAIDVTRTRIVLIGDPDQLPPVGPGQPFLDLIGSGRVPVVRLKTLHRSAEGSWIYRNAARIIEGDGVELDDCVDFEWLQITSAEAWAIADIAADKLQELLNPKGDNWDRDDVQVMSPMRDKDGGVWALNATLKAAFGTNKGRSAQINAARDTQTVHVGDRVIQTKNDYKLNVFNGEVGEVDDVLNASTIRVRFGKEYRTYKGAEMRNLMLAYACTVHRCVHPDTYIEATNFCSGFGKIGDLPDGANGHIRTAEGWARFENKFTRESGPLLRLVMDGGFELTVTPDHKLMVWLGATYELVDVVEIVPGQFLRLPLGNRKSVRIADALALQSAVPGDLREVVHKTPRRMSPELAELLGLLVGDGTVFHSGFRVTKRHREVVVRFAELCERLFGLRPSVRRLSKAHFGAEVCSTYLARWLQQFNGLQPNEKAIPEQILRGRDALLEQRKFLRGLFEDGTVNMRGRTVDHIEYTTVYPEIARLVQLMLLNIGIISSRKKYKTNWRINLYSENAKLFAKKIGFISAFKQRRLDRGAFGDTTKYLVPIDRDKLRQALPHGDSYDRQNALYRGYISRHVARKKRLPGAAGLDYHHVRVVQVEETYGPSMCVTVPEHGRFLQNGFDGGNCQGSEWPVAVVVCHSTHNFMLNRRLLYTALTRARKRIVVIGDEAGMRRALSTRADLVRRTTLQARLVGEL